MVYRLELLKAWFLQARRTLAGLQGRPDTERVIREQNRKHASTPALLLEGLLVARPCQ